eukprot:COSAG02_NODE_4940_length_4809_cov_26.880042_2_plen_59_part_00
MAVVGCAVVRVVLTSLVTLCLDFPLGSVAGRPCDSMASGLTWMTRLYLVPAREFSFKS